MPLSSLRPLPRRSRPSHRRTGLSRRSRKRLFGLLVVFVIAFSLITYKLVSIQVMGSNGLQQVSTLPKRVIPLLGVRGSILASNGDELALSEMRPTIYADPDEITDPAVEAGKLAAVLHRSAFKLEADLTEKTTYVAIVTGASEIEGTKVESLGLPGIGTQDQPVRYYPDGSLASPVIGDINAAGDGVGGLEQDYNSVLSGTAGELIEQVDPAGDPIAGTVSKDVPAKDGADILTTINPALQYQAEQVLGPAIMTEKASSGVAIVMDTKTGQILACANMVAEGHHAVQAQSVLAFTQAYDPGSVAKIITVAAGLAQHKITPTTVIPTPSQLYVAGTAFGDDGIPSSDMTPTGVLAQSSDTGAINIAQRFGIDEQYNYLKAFGVTTKTDIDFPQTAGEVRTPSEYSGTTLPTVAFGDGYDASAVQMISAVNSIANGGVYLPPSLITATVDAEGKEHVLPTPRPHRVVPTWVANDLTPMLEQVVSSGTGTAAQIPGYAVAGKTGTAATYESNGAVNNQVNNSGFVGYAPATDPALTVMVVLNNTTAFGAAAGAPAFQKIMKDALVDLGIPSDGSQPKPSIRSVPIIGGQPARSYLGE